MDTSAGARDYPRLFGAMNEVLRVLLTGGDEEEALVRSFEDASEGFGAQKAVLLLVEEREPLRLRSVHAKGLTVKQVAACERGESSQGISSSLIRAVVASGTAKLIEDPRLHADAGDTPALAGQSYSVLCCPVRDPVRDVVLAVMYFQNGGSDVEAAYRQSDVVWLAGYASALGRAFAFHFEKQRRERDLRALLQGGDRPENAPELIGDSAHIRALRRTLHEGYIPSVGAPDPDPILILGEKGTGKDLVARYLHAYSARGSRPFVPVNCAEITEELAAARFFGHKKGAFTGAISTEPGFFQAAQGGVLFLDEIAELGPRAQGSLLRVLENRTLVAVGEAREVHVDVQVVLASNRDLQKAVAEGILKPDLVDRFKTQVIRLLPLRERPSDIPPLLQHFVSYHERRTRKRTLGLTPEAASLMAVYSWPGNVRELARVCSLLVTQAKPATPIDETLLATWYPDIVQASPNPKATPALSDDVPMKDAVSEFKREMIVARLERYGWDVRAARESLRLPRATFSRYAARLGVKNRNPRPKPDRQS